MYLLFIYIAHQLSVAAFCDDKDQVENEIEKNYIFSTSYGFAFEAVIHDLVSGLTDDVNNTEELAEIARFGF